jgi:hypothetical protein
MKRMIVLFAALLVFVSATLGAQEPRSYTEGAVSVVTSVKVMDGQFDNYLDYLAKTYKPIMEEQKKAGIIVDYAVYSASARGPDDADLYLVVIYPNMASFDGLDDRTEPLMKKVAGWNRAQANAASADRTKMRTILGSEMVRELKLR